MKPPQLNSRVVRIVLAVLSIASLCFLFKYLLDIEQQNALFKEQQATAERKLLQQEKEREERFMLEQKLQKEEERKQFILDHRSVLEQGKYNLHMIVVLGFDFSFLEVTAENTNQELLNKYYIAVPTPVEPWTGNRNIKLCYH
jgi:hypothetical protein